MALVDIINEIKKLKTAELYRLKEFFNESLTPFSKSEPVFNELIEQKHKDGFTCTHCHSKNVVRFGNIQ